MGGLENKKNLLTFKSNLSATEISKDRDLCIKALIQDINIDDELVNKRNEIIALENEIKKVNTKPQPNVIEPPKRELPKKQMKRPFLWKHLFGGYNIDWDWDSSDFFVWFWTAIISIVAGSSVVVLELLTSKTAQEEVSTLAIILTFMIAAGVCGAVCYFFDFFLLKIILSVFYAVLYLVTLPIFLVINILRLKTQKAKEKKEEQKFNSECARIEKLIEDEKIQHEEKVKKLKEEIEVEWEKNQEFRKTKTIELKNLYDKLKGELQEILNVRAEARKSFYVPKEYNSPSVKKRLLTYLEKFKAYTLSEAINLYDKNLEEAKKREEERIERERIARAYEEMASAERERLMIAKQQAEENKRHNEMLEKQALESQRKIERLAKEYEESMQENREALKRLENQSFQLGSNEIDDIVNKLSEKL